MPGATPLRLTRADMPATCRAAGDLSGKGQRRTKLLVRIELLALIGAGAAGLQSFRVGPSQLDAFAGLAGLLFLLSLGALVFRSLAKPEQAWYSGRAGAESVRTLAWRYAVGGDPFPGSVDDADAAGRFLDRVREVLDELDDLELAPTGAQERELTDGMRALRAAPLVDRQAAYRRDRVDDQITWYTGKAAKHDRAAGLWLAVSAAASVIGVAAAGLRLFGVIDLDLLGVAAACASAAIAWNQLNQNRNLVSAYRLTARELAIVRDRIDTTTDETTWAAFVSDAEDAVSREHTMWLARHGHPGLRSR